jgi:hypothetical protein
VGSKPWDPKTVGLRKTVGKKRKEAEKPKALEAGSMTCTTRLEVENPYILMRINVVITHQMIWFITKKAVEPAITNGE